MEGSEAQSSPLARGVCPMRIPRLACMLALLFVCLASRANAQCGVNPSNCCFANNGRGCIEPTCCQEVCAVDPFCCATRWDALCASRAQANCGVCGVGCGNPSAGNCCAPKTTPACAATPATAEQAVALQAAAAAVALQAAAAAVQAAAP